MKKPKICKCTHTTNEHKRAHFYNNKKCTICKCDCYVRQDRPTRDDIFFAFFLPAFVGFLIGGVFMAMPFIFDNPFAPMTDDEKIEMSVLLSIGIGADLFSCIVYLRHYQYMVKRQVGIIE